MSDPAHALTLQFLAWVAESPRTYADAMEAWRSTCPRLSIWEDAILDGLVEFDGRRDPQPVARGADVARPCQVGGEPGSARQQSR